MDGFAQHAEGFYGFIQGYFPLRLSSMSNQLAGKRQIQIQNRTGRILRKVKSGKSSSARVPSRVSLAPKEVLSRGIEFRVSADQPAQSSAGFYDSTTLMSHLALMAWLIPILMPPLPPPLTIRKEFLRHDTHAGNSSFSRLSSLPLPSSRSLLLSPFLPVHPSRLRILANFREYHFTNARGRSA